MANLKFAATMSNSITAKLMVPSSVCISRGFVSATKPSEIAKVDKETAQKIKEAAVAVKEGAQEVKSVGDSVKDTVSSSAGNVISEMSKKVLDKATENEDDEEKGTWETIKEKVAGK
ncbi:uncharacterized protein LOC132642248 isoform X1 [Lycium barbarum]|uniref:uncharacterized protein LOC132642248 isoform X1 n=1 Tax=Lycium barbarum TaxID=112863 RepID=UPI00293E530B|nr:uncharacterized protein LOC132642248 isoform X1 [Lycium barbarum]